MSAEGLGPGLTGRGCTNVLLPSADPRPMRNNPYVTASAMSASRVKKDRLLWDMLTKTAGRQAYLSGAKH
ncbi:hypothetical protein NDU88_001154 [Pleurodeles waltl]|uniref:Uncharacterized protein n=1 Tax=Pleurodeles waltl TaxID=8319 RepID=A0AAV7Q576_PLEWA|nr:hypothetical protein NDU88_001154 [Pleurodeles waltl]